MKLKSELLRKELETLHHLPHCTLPLRLPVDPHAKNDSLSLFAVSPNLSPALPSSVCSTLLTQILTITSKPSPNLTSLVMLVTYQLSWKWVSLSQVLLHILLVSWDWDLLPAWYYLLSRDQIFIYGSIIFPKRI